MDILRRWLKEHEITQRRLAADVGVNPTTLSQYMHGHCKPGADVLFRLSKRTGLSVDALLAGFLSLARVKRVQPPSRRRAGARPAPA